MVELADRAVEAAWKIQNLLTTTGDWSGSRAGSRNAWESVRSRRSWSTRPPL
jgi:hypothetical protein